MLLYIRYEYQFMFLLNPCSARHYSGHTTADAGLRQVGQTRLWLQHPLRAAQDRKPLLRQSPVQAQRIHQCDDPGSILAVSLAVNVYTRGVWGGYSALEYKYGPMAGRVRELIRRMSMSVKILSKKQESQLQPETCRYLPDVNNTKNPLIQLATQENPN